MNAFSRAAVVMLASGLAACDSNSTGIDDVRTGRFEGRVSGEVSSQMDGIASSGESQQGFHDLIYLQDASRGAQLLIFHTDDEFTEGREGIASNVDLAYDNGIVAEILVNGRYFIATDGEVDIDDASSGGIDGTARFTAVELDEFDEPVFGSEVTVNVAFRTEFSSGLSFSVAPAAVGSGGLRNRHR